MAGVTDTGGVNRFPSLQPGIYSVKLELQGFRTVIRENVQVVRSARPCRSICS